MSQTDRTDSAVPARLYGADLLRAFAAGEHEDLLAGRRSELRPRVTRAIELAAIEPGHEVVDVGCGRGEASAFLARAGARVTAIDYSRDALTLTRATAEHLLAPSDAAPRLIVADATNLPLADASVDRVLLLDVIEHLRPWQVDRGLREVRRILRPEGRVVIHTLPNRWALAVAYPLLRLFAPTLPRSPRSDYERQVHVNEQSPLSLARSLRRAGLIGVVKVEEWSTHQAMAGRDRQYPDRQRDLGYPVLRRPYIRGVATLAMRSPLRWLLGNDIFAVATIEGAKLKPVRSLSR